MIERRFSLEEDFMNFKTNDLLYAFMRSLSTAEPIKDENGNITGYQEYLTKANYKKHKKIIANICGVTTRTIDNNINKLFEAGLLDEGFIRVEDKRKAKDYEYEVFWFPYDYNSKYKLVNKEFLRYLIDTRNPHSIRIYLYLLNKYEYKKNYLFTIKEISMALGYSESTESAYPTINNVLKSFAREGIIKYEDVSVDITLDNGNGCKIPNKKLLFVARSEAEINHQ